VSRIPYGMVFPVTLRALWRRFSGANLCGAYMLPMTSDLRAAWHLERGERAAGWPAPKSPRGDDAELDGRDLICYRLLGEVGWIRQCSDCLTHLRAGD
jgi:hypothetical protein